MTYYDELGVKPDATNEEIRAAYRRKAKQAHPDKGGNAEQMARVNRAYETLSSAPKRLTYDRTGQENTPPPHAAAQALVLKNVIDWLASEHNSGDMLLDVSRHFIREQAKLLDQITQADRILERLRRRLARLRFRSSGPDLVRDSVNHRIAELTRNVECIRDQVAVLDLAQEFLKRYDYEREAAAGSPVVMARRGMKFD